METFQRLLKESVSKHGHLCAGQVIGSLFEDDMPGPPRLHAVCDHCGQMVRDGKEVHVGHETLCGPCSDTSYFKVIDRYPVAETEGNLTEEKIL